MSRTKEYYHEEICAMNKNQPLPGDEDLQYKQYIESLSDNKEGKYVLIKGTINYFIINNTTGHLEDYKGYDIIAAADNPGELFAYASLKKILIINASSYVTKIS